MSSINFDNVYLLLIAVPLIAVIAIPFAITVRKDNRNGHNIASLVMHIFMALLIAFAAAGTKIITVITETQVYVVADVSYSAERNLDTVDSYIADIGKNLPRNSRLGVICFGKDYELTTKLGEKVTSVKQAEVDDSETNIVGAVEYAGSLFSGDVIKRIVLITDGNPTDTEEKDGLITAVTALKAQGIKFDAVYLNDNIDNFPDAKEVQISGAEYTENVYVGREEKVTLTVNSSYRTNALVTLYKDGEQYGSPAAPSLSAGTNSVTFTLDTSAEGLFSYKAQVEVDDDDCDLNNAYSFTQSVSGIVNVLLLTDDDSDFEKVEELYSENTQITHINVLKNKNVPLTLEELCEYDEYVICDVDLTNVDGYDLFITSLETAVSKFGKSLVTFGDLSIQKKTAGELQTLDNMLPVRYGEIENQKKLFTIVIDVSPSMQIWSRMILAKRGAEQLINSLGDSDSVCIIAFSGDVRVEQAPVMLSSKSVREDVINTVRNLSFGYGTFASLGLKKARDTITQLPYSEKQVMLITDGLPFEGDMSYEGVDYEGVAKDKEYCAGFVEEMRANHIYTSVLQVGGGNVDYRAWLKELADSGGGQYTLAETEGQLISSFDSIVGDALQLDPVHQNTFIVKDKAQDEVLQKYGEDGSLVSGGYLTGAFISDFVLNSRKLSATTVLSVKYTISSDKKYQTSVPLYAYWGYGNGRVQTYAGYLNGVLSGYLDNNTPIYSADNEGFFKNVFETALPESKNAYPYTLGTQIEGKVARIELTPSQITAGASAELTVTLPSGETVTDSFKFGTANYYYEFDLPDNGDYAVSVNYSYDGNDYGAQTYFSVSYAPEYNCFDVYDVTTLYKVVGGDGTVIENPSQKLVLENDASEVATYTLYFTVPFLIAAVVLFVVEIVVRKLKWSDIKSLFGFGKKPQGGKK